MAVNMDLDTVALGCISTLRAAMAAAVAAPESPYRKLETFRSISQSLNCFKYVLKTSPSKAAAAYIDAVEFTGNILFMAEQNNIVPIKREVPDRKNRQHGQVFGGMAIKTLSG